MYNRKIITQRSIDNTLVDNIQNVLLPMTFRGGFIVEEGLLTSHKTIQNTITYLTERYKTLIYNTVRYI